MVRCGPVGSGGVFSHTLLCVVVVVVVVVVLSNVDVGDPRSITW